MLLLFSFKSPVAGLQCLPVVQLIHLSIMIKLTTLVVGRVKDSPPGHCLLCVNLDLNLPFWSSSCKKQEEEEEVWQEEKTAGALALTSS